MSVTRAMLLATALLTTSQVLAQCLLANPSFELPGDGGETFGGWNAVGPVIASPAWSSHGGLSMRASGTGPGTQSFSGVWQNQDTSAGERWLVSLRVGHTSTNPIVGAARGVVNIEWRNGSGTLLRSESHVVLDPSSDTHIFHRVTFETGAAPPNATSVRLLLGKQQSAAQDPGQVFFDHVQFWSQSAPTIDTRQWWDFPGGRSLSFGGYPWRVKGPGWYGPGGSFFSDSSGHVWVDGQGRLHMTVRRVGSTWYSTEIALEPVLGYGDYIFTTVGDLDGMADNVILGLFTWQYPTCYEAPNPWNVHSEFDVELGRWGDPLDDLGQFVTQPWDYPGTIHRFPIPFHGPNQKTSFAFRVLANRVEARAWIGGPHDESAGNLIRTWNYNGPHIPLPEQWRIHINLWQLNGPPVDGQDQAECVDHPSGTDLTCFIPCLGTPDGLTLGTCKDDFDFDNDGDVDVRDLVSYQRNFTNP